MSKLESEPFGGRSPTGHLKSWRTKAGISATNTENKGVGSADQGINQPKDKKA